MFLKWMFLFVSSAVIASQSSLAQTPSSPPIGEVALTDRQVLDLAIQYRPELLDRAVTEALTKLQGRRAVYRFSSPEVSVPHTRWPVRGANPPCGSGETSVDGEAAKYITALQVTAGAIDKLLNGDLPIASGIAAAVNLLIANQHTYQTGAECRPVCTLILGTLAQDDLARHATIRFLFRDRVENSAAAMAVGPGDLGWSRWEEAKVIDPQPAGVTFRSRTGDERRCPSTLVCGRLKNWSHDRNRGGRLEVELDHLPKVPERCVDYSVINRDIYESVLVSSIDADGRTNLIQEYGGGVRDGAR